MEAKKVIKSINFKILSKPWSIRLLSKKHYQKKHGRDSIAIADVNKRRIDLSPAGKGFDTIVHELVHAYLSELCLHSCDLDDDNLEEIFSELLSKRGYEILRLAEKLKEKVRK